MMSKEEAAKLTLSFSAATTDRRQLLDILAEHGVAIVTDVITREECKHLEQLWLGSLQALYGSKSKAELGTQAPGYSNGFTPLHALPHSAFAWQARMHPNMRRLFAAIYGTDELCVSMDLPFYLAKRSPPAPAVTKVVPHSDQNLHHQGEVGQFEIWQSILYVWDATHPSTSSTVVQPGSHRTLWPSLMEDPGIKALADHFVQVSRMADPARRAHIETVYQAEARRAPVPAGGVLLWGSRVLHQGYTPGPRLAQPVVWEPLTRRTPETKVRKAEFCLRGYPTTHWASQGELHHVCRRMKGKDAKNAVSPTAISPVPSAARRLPAEMLDRWLRSDAALPDLVIDNLELSDLIEDAKNEIHDHQDFGPACQRLFATLKPEIAQAL